MSTFHHPLNQKKKNFNSDFPSVAVVGVFYQKFGFYPSKMLSEKSKIAFLG